MTSMRNPDAKHIDFKALEGMFPDNPKFLPSNIDMMYERNGHFLVGEWKRDGEDISGGQRLLLHRLARQAKFKVLLIIGDTDDGMNVDMVYQITPDDVLFLNRGVDGLKEVINSWYNEVKEK